MRKVFWLAGLATIMFFVIALPSKVRADGRLLTEMRLKGLLADLDAGIKKKAEWNAQAFAAGTSMLITKAKVEGNPNLTQAEKDAWATLWSDFVGYMEAAGKVADDLDSYLYKANSALVFAAAELNLNEDEVAANDWMDVAAGWLALAGLAAADYGPNIEAAYGVSKVAAIVFP